MKINLPISNLKLSGNKLYINDLVVEYEDIPKYKKQLVEKLISKNAYGSALFVLNSYVNVKAINESNVSLIEYKSYLEECNKLMKECTVKLKEAQLNKPFFNLKGIKMFESKEGIIREVNNNLYLENFNQTKETLHEKYLKSAKYGSPEWHTYKVNNKEYKFECQTWETKNSWGHSVKLYNEDKSNVLSESVVRCKDKTCNNFKFTINEACKKAINNYPNLKEDLEKLSNLVLSEEEGTQCSDIAEKKDQNVGGLQKPKKRKKLIVKESSRNFTPSELDKYVESYNSKTGSHKHPEDFTWLYMAGNVDGMKIKGVRGTQIFNVSSGEYLGDYNKWIKEEK